MKLDFLTIATAVDDTIKFVSSNQSNDKEMSLTNSDENDREETNDPDYDKDEDQLEEEQEEQIGEIPTNHVF